MRAQVRQLLFVLSLAPLVFPQPADNAKTFFLGGNQLDEPDLTKWVAAVQSSGMNTVSITAHLFQGAWNRPEIVNSPASDSATVAEIRVAKKHGLRVVLIPRVHLRPDIPENRFLWHGMILPKSNSQLRVWFERYSTHIRKWAGIARKYQVDVLAIGSELRLMSSTIPVETAPGLLDYYSNAEKLLQARTELLQFRSQVDSTHLWEEDGSYHRNLEDYLRAEHTAKMTWAKQVAFEADSLSIDKINTRRKRLLMEWQELIVEVREVYHGRLTYAANFDNYIEVAFWSRLDIIGINAYFQLRDNMADQPFDSMQTGMEANWRHIFAEIDTLRYSRGVPNHPVLFTEIGYTARKNSTIAPWTGGHFTIAFDDTIKTLLVRKKQPVDVHERARAIRALQSVHKTYPTDLLAGLLYWNFSTTAKQRDDQPFLLQIGGEIPEPLLGELLRFVVPE